MVNTVIKNVLDKECIRLVSCLYKTPDDQYMLTFLFKKTYRITYRLNNGQLFHDSLSISHPHHSYCQRNCDNYRQSLWNCRNR